MEDRRADVLIVGESRARKGLGGGWREQGRHLTDGRIESPEGKLGKRVEGRPTSD